MAAREPKPSDWCYVHNFPDAQRPRALGLPAGRGRLFRADLERLVDELRARYADLLPVVVHPEALRQDVQEHLEEFLGGDASPLEGLAAVLARRAPPTGSSAATG